MYLARQPLYENPFGLHGGRPVAGEHVDHIVPVSRGGTHDASNLQALCPSCYSKKTVTHYGGFGRARAGRKGVNLYSRRGGNHQPSLQKKSRVLRSGDTSLKNRPGAIANAGRMP